ncbi:glycosyltransferase family 2 protein [Paramicrobacterium agarici]|uniref:glycosyltransferase family 2 protein n=1 Tax=Paramicrobacterium agarici TaxID=630514 RepID=UPI00115341D2|nr:glycosyltransferase family 2 protein [Microbacterium agarici]TQO21537.1 cellulose synthase/poly-beta-1,6-N-acetylglucosamine synthase-like glycosyltransferase [Microbacterium agarici]
MGTSASEVPSSGTLPGVSYVMPVLNDVTHVRAAVDSLLGQDYQGPFDVAIAVGPSIDGTNELVEALSRADSRVRVIENPVGSTPAGLNIAIQATQHPIIVRVDAHSVLPPEYTRIAVETMMRTGAGNVGGIMDAQGTTPFEEAVAAAYGSRIGLGGTPHHVGGSEGPADTVYLGVFRRDALNDVGLFDERIKRGQDWELNRRIRQGGHTVWFTPRLRVVYRPRPTLSRLARQFFSTGMWRGEISRRFPARNVLRYFAPPLMVIAVAVASLLGLVGLVQALLGVAPWLLLAFIVPVGYILLVIAAAITMPGVRGAAVRLWLLIVLPCIHFCWGVGFIPGFLLLAGNIAAQKYEKGEGSRVAPE